MHNFNILIPIKTEKTTIIFKKKKILIFRMAEKK